MYNIFKQQVIYPKYNTPQNIVCTLFKINSLLSPRDFCVESGLGLGLDITSSTMKATDTNTLRLEINKEKPLIFTRIIYYIYI